ncbi:hypothetical protein SAMN04487936_105202 [Halobacillus dabanensis]|uniref:Uncharacterized protein n=1 Tax=Halobacillus dabanensis TaxID=240302 RepID=A0A1I3V8N0_HALDA|nr:hypothetical protein [Halobacillus dabanensis]SFJ91758.1 hypothetical protein SAMN04487936_105202 [Halobacillus dabanensis]
MVNRLLLSLCAILLLAGCLHQSEDIQVLTATPKDYELHLYTDSENENTAQDYMSALLDWKLKQEDATELQFKQSETKKDHLNIPDDELPVLVVKEKGKTITTISGENPRKEILMALEKNVTVASR